MKMKQRVMAKTILKAIKRFPALLLTGSRQSGKTTLFKMLFSKTHNFINLEDPDVRLRVKGGPVGFLNQYELPVVIDEIQYVPELLSYIKTKIDNNRSLGQTKTASIDNKRFDMGDSLSFCIINIFLHNG